MLNTTDSSAISAWCFAAWQKQALFRCKRGNLEVELILTAYLKQLNNRLGENEAAQIDALLNESEQNLFNWLVNIHEASSFNAPPDHYRALIAQIKANYLNSQ